MKTNGSIIKQLFNTPLNTIRDSSGGILRVIVSSIRIYTVLQIMLTPDQVLCIPTNLTNLVGDVRFSPLPALTDQHAGLGFSLRHSELCRVPWGSLRGAGRRLCTLSLASCAAQKNCASRLPTAPFFSNGSISGLQRFLLNFFFIFYFQCCCMFVI